MHIKAIHQFHPACSSGDGVSNGMLFTRRLLQECGFASEIYCDHIPEDMRSVALLRAQMVLGAQDLLLMHHSLGYENCAWLAQVKTPKVLVYHNITPPHLLPELGGLRRLSALGREQLAQWAPDFIGAIGDSALNTRELHESGYTNVRCIPLLVDLDRLRDAPWDPAFVAPLRNAINLLFVGRVCENKHQLKLIDIVHELRHFSDQPVRLILAGGISSGDYHARIEARIAELDLGDHVVLAGKVPDAGLAALYRISDAFVCMSEHEGFGMPLIEAMMFDVPVLAQATSSIPDTLGTGGLIMKNDDPREAAALLHMLFTEPALRRRLIKGQQRNLARFAPDFLREELAQFLRSLGIELPHAPPAVAATHRPYWQVEGPFDSTYSLAIVNREVARALTRRGLDTGLRSMEGGGEFNPAPAFLSANGDCAAMVRRATEATRSPDVSLRFCYPPEVNDMRGAVRAMHSYGWEETGFPIDYVAAFNRRLDLVTVLSGFVEKVLRDNGVRIPIAVTGGGVDHLIDVAEIKPELEMRTFRFLHVSSCFPRKGVDALLAAYGKAFSMDDDVSLVIKTFPNPHNDVQKQLTSLRRANSKYPHVVLINRDCSDGELVGLYRACDVFVAPSRGEGLGLPMAEAMLFRLPVITTNWGGQTDFCDESSAWLCDYHYTKAQTHFGATHSVWADPDVGHLSSLLKTLQKMTPAEREPRVTRARERILRDFTWARVAERLEQSVALLQQQPLLRKEPKIGWISSWNTRCGIAAYSAFLSQAIPADRLLVLANRTSERTAPDLDNVQRCWNMHSDETLADTVAMIVEQDVGVVVIQYNFGFFSLATLAALIETLAKKGIAVHCFFHATADLVREGVRISLGDITAQLAVAERLYVHGVEDLNRLKQFGLVDNVVFFPQGVLPTPDTPPGSEKQALALHDKRVLAAYGFLLPHKGIQNLIRAFAPLVSEDPTLHLLLVNALYPVADSVQEQKACLALIDKLGIAASVTLVTDYLSDAQCLSMLRAADLIVYPYQQTQESSSAAVRMALAAGRPVAVTPISIFDDVGEIVHRLPGTDPASLTRGIRELLTTPGALQCRSDIAQQWTASRQWPLLSTRLRNSIDGLANPLVPYARHD